MSLIIKKKICLGFFLLSSFSLSLYGMKRSKSCFDINLDKFDSQQLQRVRHGFRHRRGLKSGLYDVLDLDCRGRVKNSVLVENPVEMPPKAVRILLNKDYKENKTLLVPGKLSESIPFWRQCLNIFSRISNSPIVKKYVEEEVLPQLIIFLQDRFLMENKNKRELREQLSLEAEEGKRLEEKLQKQRESLKNDLRYCKQLSLLHGCLLSSKAEES